MTTVNVPTSPQPDPTPVALARIEEKLDNALKTQEHHGTLLTGHDARIDRVEDRLTKVETRYATEGLHARVTALEKRMWGWVGAASILSSGGVAAIFQILN